MEDDEGRRRRREEFARLASDPTYFQGEVEELEREGGLASSGPQELRHEVQQLRAEVEELRNEVRQLRARLG